MKQLEAIKERAESATEGPWSLAHPRPDGRNMVERRGYDLYGDEVSEMIIVDTNPSDAEFIAHSRTDIPKLIAALEAVEAKLQWLDFIQAEHAGGRHNLNAGGAASVLRQVITEALA